MSKEVEFKSRKDAREFIKTNDGYVLKDRGERFALSGRRWVAESKNKMKQVDTSVNVPAAKSQYAILTTMTHGEQSVPTVVAVFDEQGIAFNIARNLMINSGHAHQVVQLPPLNFVHDAYMKVLMNATGTEETEVKDA